MLRISLSYIIEVMATLERINSIPLGPAKISEIASPLMQANAAIHSLHGEGYSLYAPYLRVSWHSAQKLLSHIMPILEKSGAGNEEIEAFDLILLKQQFNHYKIALLAELDSLNAYFVTQKGSHDTLTLLAAGEALFPANLGQKVPEAVFDVREAGKCLAFELPTACGFHVFRATESVLRAYYDHTTGGKARPKVRSLGVYIQALVKAGHGNPKVLAILKQMTDLYRNPLVHPEAVLVTEEALAIVGIARSAVSAMLAELPEVAPTTSMATSSPAS